MNYYYVVKNDTLFPVNELKKINSLKTDDIYIGQKLIIPDYPRDIYDRYLVQKSDTLYKIAKEYNVTPDLLWQINGMEKNESIKEGQTLLVPKKGFSFMITKEGDTLRQIAKKLNTTVMELLYSNVSIYLLPDQLIVYQDLQKVWLLKQNVRFFEMIYKTKCPNKKLI